jgi:exonuclease III
MLNTRWLAKNNNENGKYPPYGCLSDGSVRTPSPSIGFEAGGPVTPLAQVNGQWEFGKSVRWAGYPSDNEADASSPVRGDSVWFNSPLPGRQRFVSPVLSTTSSSLPAASELGGNEVEKTRICLMGTGPMETLPLLDRLRPVVGLILSSKIHKVKCIRQPNDDFRMDLWISADAASIILRKLKRVRKWGWRAVHWRSWADRFDNTKKESVPPPLPRKIGIATYNVNGWRGKAEQLEYFLYYESIAVALIQETLVYDTDKPISIDGYDTFPIDAKRGIAGRRGQVLCVHKNLKATSLNLNDSNIVGARTAKIPGFKGSWYIFGLYLPSGGNYRLERGQILGRLRRMLRSLICKDPEAQIIVGGDWNIERANLQNIISKWKLPLEMHPMGGSPKTRRTRVANAPWTSIDGFLVTKNMERALNVSRVNRDWDLSDHYPVVCSVKGNATVPMAKEKLYMDRRKIAKVAPKIASDNRWQLLEAMGNQMDPDLDKFEAEFTKTCYHIASDNNLIVTTSGKRTAHCLDRETRQMINKRRTLNSQLVRSNVEARKRVLLFQILDLKSVIRLRIKKSRKNYRMTLIKHGVNLWVTGQIAAWWKWLDSLVHYRLNKSTRGSYPLYDNHNNLQVSDKGIADVLRQHYEQLGKDQSGKSSDKEFWKGLWSNEPQQVPNHELFGKPITWNEVHKRLGKTAYGRATGIDGIPYEFLRVARTGHNDKNPVPPNSMAKAVLLYTQLCFGKGRLPKEDLKSRVISIFKNGETSRTSNYRGIFLINHKAKLVNGIETERFVEQLELTDHLYPEQGGFRRGEAVLENVCALYELVRRRALEKLPTYLFFGDLVKAFDKVPFGAVLASMEAAGVTHPATSLIWSTYTNSVQCCSVGDATSDPFVVEIGTKQGDVPSPPKFDVFINPLIRRLREGGGVSVPGLRPESRISSFLFADDELAVAGSIEQLQEAVTISEKWSDDMSMKWGIPKCGVMILGATPEQKLQ